MRQQIDTKSREIADRMRDLGRRLERGDESEFLTWVIPDQLACGHRPLRHHQVYGGSARNLDSGATSFLFEWVEFMQVYDVQSIICLMHENELAYYNALDLNASNLVEFYRFQGFKVCHLPWEDPAHSDTDLETIAKQRREIRHDALEAFDNLPKPVLLHCSAGIQRSAPVAAFIWWHRGAQAKCGIKST